MGEHTPTPWQIYDAADPHHIMIKGFYPVLGGAHVADVLFPENAAFIVKACNSHDTLVKALEEIATGCDDEHLHPFNSVWAELIKSRAREVLAKVQP